MGGRNSLVGSLARESGNDKTLSGLCKPYQRACENKKETKKRRGGREEGGE